MADKKKKKTAKNNPPIVVKENQVFNLFDSNGRRSDTINALQVYMNILNDLLRNNRLTWDRVPKSPRSSCFLKRLWSFPTALSARTKITTFS